MRRRRRWLGPEDHESQPKKVRVARAVAQPVRHFQHAAGAYDIFESSLGSFSRMRRVTVVKLPEVVVNSASTHVPRATSA